MKEKKYLDFNKKVQVFFKILCVFDRKSKGFSTKKECIIVLTSNEFRQLEILNGENPQSPFKMGGSKWQQQKYGKYKRD
ncbi:MAG: hypothetical protein ACLSW4_01645 [Clostridia bacterium]